MPPPVAFISAAPLHVRRHGHVHISLRSRHAPRIARVSRLRSAIIMSSSPNIPPTPPPSSKISSSKPFFSRFNITRLSIFFCMSVLYSAYVFLRSTFTYVSPILASNLSLSLSAIGSISSAFPIAYALSRLFTGVLVDRTRPHLALILGLLLAASVNIGMGLVSSASLLALLWALNGLVQGVGAGSSAKLLTSWFSSSERGLYWALWSTSANIGGIFAPIICGVLATSQWGFRAGLIVPGVFAAALAVGSVLVLRSTPEEAGLTPPWEPEVESSKPKVQQEKVSWKEAFVNGVVKNKTIWLLAISYFFVYLVRSGLKSWLHFWLISTQSLSISEAAYRVSGMEMGGILGTFSAGVVSDYFNGRRIAVTIAYLLGLFAALYAVYAGTTGAFGQFAAISVAGFMINGPQMMIGLVGAEVSDKKVVATATGVLGFISYLGAAASGGPLSIVIHSYGWSGYFVTLLASVVLSVVCLLPMYKLRANASG